MPVDRYTPLGRCRFEQHQGQQADLFHGVLRREHHPDGGGVMTLIGAAVHGPVEFGLGDEGVLPRLAGTQSARTYFGTIRTDRNPDEWVAGNAWGRLIPL